ncbi:hypothetical protein LGQ02_11975 [Bacillus shivajii]|uniref:hypothetical protein n=1 Tax=Bacillus shivajii TaxID=1983719 RepID=UPI001CFB8F96|nr:hypothetical protein [Bacillus shivajii]UCZ51588.1 hypothetical protein LGQ02_11975 [Bacillus shivajii]
MGKKKKIVQSKEDKYQHSWKIVLSDKCEVCTTQCTRGLRYLQKMSVPGSSGKGVPCHLTKGKAMK